MQPHIIVQTKNAPKYRLHRNIHLYFQDGLLRIMYRLEMKYLSLCSIRSSMRHYHIFSRLNSQVDMQQLTNVENINSFAVGLRYQFVAKQHKICIS